MSCRFKTKQNIANKNAGGFTLIEITASVMILGLIAVSVITVINNSIEIAIDNKIKTQAFELARENMERLLASFSVSESVDFGTSYENPELTWETTVETFYEQRTERMWAKAVSSATYFDTKGREQTITLEHWITDLSKNDMLKVLKQKEQQRLTGLAMKLENQPQTTSTELSGAEKLIGGYTEDELNAMPFDQVWKIFTESMQ